MTHPDLARNKNLIAALDLVLRLVGELSEQSPEVAEDPGPQVAPQLLTIPEVAERLEISELTVHRMACRGDLPAVRIGGRVAVIERDLAQWIEDHRIGKLCQADREEIKRRLKRLP